MIFIKKIFNAIFSEDKKKKLREKYSVVFIHLDKRLYKKAYLKAIKEILKAKIDMTDGYVYRNDIFLKNIKDEYVKYLIMNDKEVRKNKNFDECVNYIKKNGLKTFCYDNIDYNIYKESDIFFDVEKKLYWVYYNKKKLYFKKSINTVSKVLNVINMLVAEQSLNSPHRYLSDDFNVDEDDIVFDIGCAEGNFSLDIVDRVKEIYLFEADSEWIEALKYTFEEYMDKIHIVPFFVSDNDNRSIQQITIDKFCEDNKIDNIHFMKMDVEGAEPKVLNGAKRMLSEGRITSIAACTYHNADDEQKIRHILKNYDCCATSGYMQVADRNEIWNIGKPYFCHTLLRCKKITTI